MSKLPPSNPGHEQVAKDHAAGQKVTGGDNTKGPTDNKDHDAGESAAEKSSKSE